MTPRYIGDSDVDAELDRELRGLLATCFTKPQDHVFRVRRYFREPPAHRWLLRESARGLLVGHVAAHEREIVVAGRAIAVGGLSEVCVHPDFQGHGHLRALVRAAHADLAARGRPFSLLFGEARYYASSGYREAKNLWFATPGGGADRRAEGAKVAVLGAEAWPGVDPVLLRGGGF